MKTKATSDFLQNQKILLILAKVIAFNQILKIHTLTRANLYCVYLNIEYGYFWTSMVKKIYIF